MSTINRKSYSSSCSKFVHKPDELSKFHIYFRTLQISLVIKQESMYFSCLTLHACFSETDDSK